MAAVVTRVDLHETEIDRLLRSSSGPIYREVARRTRRVTALAKTKANVRTGRMRAEIRGDTDVRGTDVVGTIKSPAPYSRWVHEGRGWVYPKRAKALRFWVNDPRPVQRGNRGGEDGGWVFAKSARPYPGHPFMTEALREGQDWPVIVHK